ncbi:hypothetical protein ONE63_007980 [Megalurothrips usitatus]|uniref:Uncharacterized protein n=1 Tax=Megalurothrips usitatus TaxID=439358 RepID=A0AAV7XTH1_9NEOP|nr:hypothetical protein ONE63_007980 [Megalurothrips usitatus]
MQSMHVNLTGVTSRWSLSFQGGRADSALHARCPDRWLIVLSSDLDLPPPPASSSVSSSTSSSSMTDCVLTVRLLSPLLLPLLLALLLERDLPLLASALRLLLLSEWTLLASDWTLPFPPDAATLLPVDFEAPLLLLVDSEAPLLLAPLLLADSEAPLLLADSEAPLLLADSEAPLLLADSEAPLLLLADSETPLLLLADSAPPLSLSGWRLSPTTLSSDAVLSTRRLSSSALRWFPLLLLLFVEALSSVGVASDWRLQRRSWPGRSSGGGMMTRVSLEFVLDNGGRSVPSAVGVPLESRFGRGMEASRELDGQEAGLDGLEAALGGLMSEQGGLVSELGGLEAALGGLVSELGGLEAALGGLVSELGGLEAALGGLVSEQGGLVSELGGLEAVLEGLDAELEPGAEPVLEHCKQSDTSDSAVECPSPSQPPRGPGPSMASLSDPLPDLRDPTVDALPVPP